MSSFASKADIRQRIEQVLIRRLKRLATKKRDKCYAQCQRECTDADDHYET